MDLFDKYQTEIVRLANLDAGRKLLGIENEKDSIIKVTPNAYFAVSDKVRGFFRTYPLFERRLAAALTQLDIAEQYHGLGKYRGLLNYVGMFKQPNLFPNVHLATFFPDASSTDGITSRSVASETFSTIRGGAGTGADETQTAENIANLRASTTNNEYDLLQRGIIGWVTSSIGSSPIAAATIDLYDTVSDTSLGDSTVDVVSASPTSNTTLASGDFTSLGSTVFADITMSTISATSYNTLTLNANGRANINTSGNSNFGFRLGWDTDNSFGGSWSNSQATRWGVQMSETAGTSQDPLLTVTMGGGGNPLFFSQPGVAVG